MDDKAQITEELKKIMLPEASATKERWADIRLQALDRYRNLLIGNGEREFNLSLTLVSISVAFLTIVVPLLNDYTSPFFLFGLCCFFISAILGVVDLLWTIYRDRHYLQEDLRWEDGMYKRFQTKSVDFYTRLTMGPPVTRGDIKVYLDKGDSSKETQERSETRNKLFSTKALVFTHRCFIIAFFFGFLILMVVIGDKINTQLGWGNFLLPALPKWNLVK